MLTCYEASLAALMHAYGVEILLAGDSLGMPCHGGTTTAGVSLEDMV